MNFVVLACWLCTTAASTVNLSASFSTSLPHSWDIWVNFKLVRQIDIFSTLQPYNPKDEFSLYRCCILTAFLHVSSWVMNTPRHVEVLCGPGKQSRSCQGKCPWDVNCVDKHKGKLYVVEFVLNLTTNLALRICRVPIKKQGNFHPSICLQYNI